MTDHDDPMTSFSRVSFSQDTEKRALTAPSIKRSTRDHRVVKSPLELPVCMSFYNNVKKYYCRNLTPTHQPRDVVSY